MKRNGPLAIIFHTLFVVFILAPLVMVVVISFTPEAYLSFPTNGLSLRWFWAIADNREFVSAFWASLWIGFAAAVLALALSVPAAIAVHRFRFFGRDAMIALFLSPLIIPHVVLGVAFLRFFVTIGILRNVRRADRRACRRHHAVRHQAGARIAGQHRSGGGAGGGLAGCDAPARVQACDPSAHHSGHRRRMVDLLHPEL